MKGFKEMFEDAPVNATGDAVATNEPIVRKKKKKEDSSGREIGTPELLKRYRDDTPGQNEDTGEHPPHVKDKEKEKKKVVLKGSLSSVHEARLMTDGKLVTTVDAVLGSILKKLKSEMGKRYKKDKKDGMAYINSIAKMVGMTATDKGQQKGKLFLRLGEDLEEGAKYTNIHNKIKKIRNLKRKESEFIANIDPAVLGQVVKALMPMFEETDIQEGLIKRAQEEC